MKLKFLGFALLAVCVCAVCCMCGSDSKTPDYEFPDGPDPDPDPTPDPTPDPEPDPKPDPEPPVTDGVKIIVTATVIAWNQGDSGNADM